MSKVLEDARAALASQQAVVEELEAQQTEGSETVTKAIEKITVLYTDGSSEDFTSGATTGTVETPPSETPAEPSAGGSATSSDTTTQETPVGNSDEVQTSTTEGQTANSDMQPTG